jgi:tetratricopeptide (TPR) repeat protein
MLALGRQRRSTKAPPEDLRMRVFESGRGLGVFGILAAALVVATAPALADPPPEFPPCTREPTQADIEGAAGSHRAAKAYYERGEYDRAVQLWRDAYNFDCTKPAVFLNMANAYEKKGDKVAAIAMLEIYLVRAPKDAADASTIAAKINNLKNSLKTDPGTPPTPSASATADPGPAPTSTVGPDKPVPPPEGERPYGVLPWIVAGAGAAIGIGGVIPLAIGFGKISDAEKLCGESHTDCPPDDKLTPAQKKIKQDGSDGQTLVPIGWILVGVGGAALVGGLVWQFAFNQRQPATTTGQLQTGVRLLPAVGPRQQGVVLTGQF